MMRFSICRTLPQTFRRTVICYVSCLMGSHIHCFSVSRKNTIGFVYFIDCLYDIDCVSLPFAYYKLFKSFWLLYIVFVANEIEICFMMFNHVHYGWCNAMR